MQTPAQRWQSLFVVGLIFTSATRGFSGSQTCGANLQYFHDRVVNNLNVGPGNYAHCYPYYTPDWISQSYFVPGSRSCRYRLTFYPAVYYGNDCISCCYGDGAGYDVYRFNPNGSTTTLYSSPELVSYFGNEQDDCGSGMNWPTPVTLDVQGEDVIQVSYYSSGCIYEQGPGIGFYNLGVQQLSPGPLSDVSFDLKALPKPEDSGDFVIAQMTQPSSLLYPWWRLPVANGCSLVEIAPGVNIGIDVYASGGSVAGQPFTLECYESLTISGQQPLDLTYGLSLSTFSKSLTVLNAPHNSGIGIPYAGGQSHHRIELYSTSPGVYNGINWRISGASRGCTIAPKPGDPTRAILTLGNDPGLITIYASDTQADYEKGSTINILPEPQIGLFKQLCVNRVVQAGVTDPAAFGGPVVWSIVGKSPVSMDAWVEPYTGIVHAGTIPGNIRLQIQDADGYYIQGDFTVWPLPTFGLITFDGGFSYDRSLVVGSPDWIYLIQKYPAVMDFPLASFVGNNHGCSLSLDPFGTGIDSYPSFIRAGASATPGQVTIHFEDDDGFWVNQTFLVRTVPSLSYSPNPVRAWGTIASPTVTGDFLGGVEYDILTPPYGFPNSGGTVPTATVQGTSGQFAAGGQDTYNLPFWTDVVAYDPDVVDYWAVGTIVTVAAPPIPVPKPTVGLSAGTVPTGGTIRPTAFVIYPWKMNLAQAPGVPWPFFWQVSAPLGTTMTSGGLITPGNTPGIMTIWAIDPYTSEPSVPATLNIVEPDISFAPKTILLANGSQTTASVNHPEAFPGGINWSISSGGEYATMPTPGVIQSKVLTGTVSGTVTVRATSVSNPAYYVEDVIRVKSVPTVSFDPPYLIADGSSRTVATVSDSEVFPSASWSLIPTTWGATVIVNNANPGMIQAGPTYGDLTVTVQSPPPDNYQITATLRIKERKSIEFSKPFLQADGTSTATASVDSTVYPNVIWSLVPPPLAGTTIDASGVIRAGPTPGQIRVRATDQTSGFVIDEEDYSIRTRIVVAFDVVALKADSKSKCWAVVLPLGPLPSSITWSIQGPDLGCTIPDPVVGRLTAGTTAGKIVVRAADASDPAYFGEAILDLADECKTDCANGNCVGGGGVANNNSVDVSISLGYANFGLREVSLHVKESLPSATLVTPAKLWLAASSADVEVYPPSGTMQQIKSPSMLAVITDITSSGYNVKLYSNNQLQGGHVPGMPYVVISGQQPFCTWSIAQIGGDINHIQVTEARGGKSYLADYTYLTDANGTGWDMLVDDNKRKESRRRLANVETYTIRNVADNTIKYQETRTYQTFTWGDELVSLTVGTGPNAFSTSWFYNTDSSDAPNYRRVDRLSFPGGSWETYKYDIRGRRVRVVSQFLDNPLPASASDENNNYVKVCTYDDINNIAEEIVHLKGTDAPHEISHKYTVRSTEGGEDVVQEIRCQNRSVTSITAPGNLTTKTWKYPAGSQFEHEIHKVSRPDGTMLLFAYSAADGLKTTTVKEGQPNGGVTDVIDGIKTITVVDAAGNVLSEQQYDIINRSLPLSSKTGSNRDIFGRPQIYTYPDGSYEAVSYGCCGVDSITDRAGVQTQYVYDSLKRPMLTTRAGVSTLTEYNVQGKLERETRISPDGSAGSVSKVLKSYVYDTAGRMSQSTDLIGPTTYAYVVPSTPGHKVITTVYPNNSTKVETYYQDGKILSVDGTAVYPVISTYDTDADGFYQKDTKVRGAVTDEWVKNYADLLQRPVKTTYPLNTQGQTPYTQNYYLPATGQLWKQRDADGVVALFAYNNRGELYRKAFDMDRDDMINTDLDRVEEYGISVQPQGGVMLGVKRTHVWDKDGANPAVRTERLALSASLDGSYQNSTEFGQSTTRVVTYDRMARKKTETDILPDNTQRITTYVDGRLDAVKLLDASTPTRQQLSRIANQYYTSGNSCGFLQSSTDARNGTTSYTYNAADQIETITTPVPGYGQTTAQVTRFAYNELDSQGRVETVTLPDLTTVTRTYRLTGELKRTTGTGEIPVEYDYEQGRIKTIKTWRAYGDESSAQTTTLTYSLDRGFLQSKNYAGSPGPAFTYYDSGRMKTRAWPGGATTSHTYNNAGDIWQVDYSDTPTSPDVTYSYTSRGQVKTVVDQTGTHTTDYYTHGRPHTETHTGGAIDGMVVEYNYDTMLRRQWTIARRNGAEIYRQGYEYDPADSYARNLTFNGVCVHYAYENNAPLVSDVSVRQGTEAGATILTGSRQHNYLNQLVQTTTAGADAAVSFTSQFNDLNKRQRVTLHDSSYWIYTYDAHGQLQTAKKFWADNSPVAGQQFEYAFDDAGNRQNVRFGGDNVGGGLHRSAYVANARNQYESRDMPGFANILGAANSLATVTADDKPALRKGQYFAVDLPVDNSSQAINKDVTVRGVRWDASMNRDVMTASSKAISVPLAHSVFSYDNGGNLQSDGTFPYTWDAENRLRSIELSRQSSQVVKVFIDYDHLGRRVQRTTKSSADNGVTWVDVAVTKYVYDGWNLLVEFDGVGAALRSYAWGPDDSGTFQNNGSASPVLARSWQIVPGTFYVAADVLGNVAALFNATDGKTAAVYEYGPFGESIRSTGVAADVCPFRFASKYYDNDAHLVYYGHRYFSSSLGRWLSLDPIGEVGGLNLYGFVNNDPINQQDLLGLASFSERMNRIVLAAQNSNPAEDSEPGYWDEVDRRMRLFGEHAIVKPIEGVVMGGIGLVEYVGRFPFHPIEGIQTAIALPGQLAHGLKCFFKDKYGRVRYGDINDIGDVLEESLGDLFGILATYGLKESDIGNIMREVRFCFPPGTLVLMADGTTKAIENIQEGDEVLSEQPLDSQEVLAKQVIQVHTNWTQRLIHIAVDQDGDGKPDGEFQATGHHPVWTHNRGWVNAEDLSAGDRLLDLQQCEPIVCDLREEKTLCLTYNLSVEDSHTFFVMAGQAPVLVHNAAPVATPIRTYIVYTAPDPLGGTYVGRASMPGAVTAREVLQYRVGSGHHRNIPIEDFTIQETFFGGGRGAPGSAAGYDAARGSEYLYQQKFRERGLLAGQNAAIRIGNPNFDRYIKAALARGVGPCP